MVPHEIPGVQVVFANKGKVIYDEAFGFANLEEQRPADTLNYARIASVSKAVTRACCDLLKYQGKLDFGTKVFPGILKEFDLK